MSVWGRLRSLPGILARLPDELRQVERSIKESAKAQADGRKALSRDLASLRAETTALREDTDRRMRQYHLQLGRLSALMEGRDEVATFSSRVPMTLDGEPPQGETAPPAMVAAAAGDDWLTLDACPACATPDRTIVCEWNKLVLLEKAPDRESWIYDYALCHGCGILYATRRPTGRRYRYLMEHFEDVVDKDSSNPVLNPHPLTEADRVRYRALIEPGIFVSDHARVPYLEGVFKDRFETSGHVDLLGSLLDLRGRRVLEVRSRAGTIVEGLKRLYEADVYAMPIFESQQFVLRELYGIPTSDLIDFENFAIPFDGPFDLIACNHMFNHAVRLDRFLASVRSALCDGGHLYLYNEIDDGEFLDGTQSMVATMNPLHLQATDGASLARALAANGFEPVFITTRQRRSHNCLVRKIATPSWQPMEARERDARIARYQRARDRAVLRAPEPMRPRFAGVWAETIERAVATGLAVFDEQGAVKIVKS